MNNTEIIETWLKKTVIGLGLCPFAKEPFENGSIRFNNCESVGLREVYSTFIEEIELLHSSESIETTLLIVPHAPTDFLDFNDFIFTLEEALEDNNLSQYFQIVGFHPHFVFDGLDKDQRTNFVNRSPIPLIHILKTSSIENLNLEKSDGEAISHKNEELLNNMPEDDFLKHFKIDK
jgi:hypothetical protein